MSNIEKWVFPSLPEVNPRGGSSSSFDPNDVRKVNVVISLWLGKKVDTHMGEQDVKDSPSPSSSPPFLQGDDICPSLMIQIPSKDVDGPKESESFHNSTSPNDSSSPFTGVIRPPPPFPNRLNGKRCNFMLTRLGRLFSKLRSISPCLI